MSMSVSVRPWGYLRKHVRSLPNCLCMLPMTVALAGWRNPKRKGQFLGFLPHWQCIVQHSIWDPCTNRLNRLGCHLGWWVGLARGTVYYVGVTIPKGKGTIWRKRARQAWHCYKLPIWTGVCSGVHMIGADASLQALDESTISCKGVGLNTMGNILYLQLPCLHCCFSRIYCTIFI